MAYPQKITAQTGTPIKIVDETLTSPPPKKSEIQNFEPKRIVRAPIAGKSQSTSPGILRTFLQH